MKTVETDELRRSLKRLPNSIQRIYRVQTGRFVHDWRDPRLHIKKLRELSNVFSFRVTRNYRVLFFFQEPEVAIFFEIDHRKDVYRGKSQK